MVTGTVTVNETEEALQMCVGLANKNQKLKNVTKRYFYHYKNGVCHPQISYSSYTNILTPPKNIA